jgi:hypothetical protein
MATAAPAMIPAVPRLMRLRAVSEVKMRLARSARSRVVVRTGAWTRTTATAISMKTTGVIDWRSTTSGISYRKKTITLGLPSVSDSEPRKLGQERTFPFAASTFPAATGAVQILQAM